MKRETKMLMMGIFLVIQANAAQISTRTTTAPSARLMTTSSMSPVVTFTTNVTTISTTDIADRPQSDDSPTPVTAIENSTPESPPFTGFRPDTPTVSQPETIGVSPETPTVSQPVITVQKPYTPILQPGTPRRGQVSPILERKQSPVLAGSTQEIKQSTESTGESRLYSTAIESVPTTTDSSCIRVKNDIVETFTLIREAIEPIQSRLVGLEYEQYLTPQLTTKNLIAGLEWYSFFINTDMNFHMARETCHDMSLSLMQPTKLSHIEYIKRVTKKRTHDFFWVPAMVSKGRWVYPNEDPVPTTFSKQQEHLAVT